MYDSETFAASGPDIGLDPASAAACTPRWYGVSIGNGNDGVSQLHPDYYVRTADPYATARLALILSYSGGSWRDHAAAECVTDGESDYTVYATLYEGPDGETQYGAAERCVEVFPVDPPADWDWFGREWGEYGDGRLAYESNAAAFGADTVARYDR